MRNRQTVIGEQTQLDGRTRQLRAWITHRNAQMTQRKLLMNQVQKFLGRWLVTSPFKLLWAKKGLAWLNWIDCWRTSVSYSTARCANW